VVRQEAAAGWLAGILKVFRFDFAFFMLARLQFVFGSGDPDTEDIFAHFFYIYFTIYQPSHGWCCCRIMRREKNKIIVFFLIYYSIKFCCFLLFILFLLSSYDVWENVDIDIGEVSLHASD
jgi:hypothetical protein